jgi:hypothetical protein
VLPAAVPELSYDALEGVRGGGSAIEAFNEAIHSDTTPGAKVKSNAYCRLDTFGMVRLWEFFSGRNELSLQDGWEFILSADVR